jgi:hypothetical protein
MIIIDLYKLGMISQSSVRRILGTETITRETLRWTVVASKPETPASTPEMSDIRYRWRIPSTCVVMLGSD